jgi:hypothetical protein
MTFRILTIAAATAIAVTAFGFNAPASAAPLGLASQTIAQSAAQSLDSPVLEINRKGGHKGKRGKWGGHKGKWHGHKRHRDFRYRGHKKFHFGFHAPYYYDPCYTQVLVGGQVALIQVC